MPTHPGGDCRRVMESSASPVLTRPTNSSARLGMLPTQGMMVGEAINLGIASSCKTNSTHTNGLAGIYYLASEGRNGNFAYCLYSPATVTIQKGIDAVDPSHGRQPGRQRHAGPCPGRHVPHHAALGNWPAAVLPAEVQRDLELPRCHHRPSRTPGCFNQMIPGFMTAPR